MKSTTEVNPTYKFWVENKIANERTFFLSDIKQQFQKWLLTKEIEWLKYYDSHTVVTTFITSKDGLNSVFENSKLDDLVRGLKPDYKNILNGINPVTKTKMQ